MKNAAFLLMYIRRNSYTWEELGLLLKNFWWLVVFMVLLFVYSFRGYRQHMEEQREQERQREFWGDTYTTEEGKQEPDRYDEKEMPPSEGWFERRQNWRWIRNFFILGFLMSMGIRTGAFATGEIFALLFLLVFMLAVCVAIKMPADWVYTSFEADREAKRIDWKKVLQSLLPYGVALLAGLVVGMLAGLM